MRVGVLYGITLLVVASCSVLAWQERTNALENYEGWVATKTTHGLHLMGSRPFVEGPQALSGNRLNLHAWPGFQEVWRRVDRAGIDGVRFDLYLAPDAYGCFWWGELEGPRHGVLFSNREGRSGAFLEMDQEGRFLSHEPRPELASLGRGWHRVELDWAAGAVHLNGEVLNLPENPGGDFEAMGFRGGREPVLVDALQWLSKGEVVYSEHFFNRENLAWRLALVGIAALFLLAGIEALARWMRSPFPLAARSSLCVTVVVVAMGAYAYVRFVETRSYPDLSGRIAFFDQDFRERLKESFRSEFEAAYGVPEPNTEALRVLFLGGSQTWGAGASEEERSFVKRIEGRLSQELGRPVVCMNGGVRSARMQWLADIYTLWLRDYGPDLVVLNVSSNDTDLSLFSAQVRRFVRVCVENDVPLVLVCEAESPEAPSNLESFHDVMRAIGKGMGVMAVEAHAYLQEHEDSGLLWWDHVHPTDYGHALLAECIFPAVYGALHAEKMPERPPITRVPRRP